MAQNTENSMETTRLIGKPCSKCVSGLKLKDLQHRLGHSSIAITADIYTHTDIDMQTEAVKAFEDSMSGL